MYGRPPPTYIVYILGESSVVVVDQSLRKRNAMIRLLKANLIQAQVRLKGYANKRSERTFVVGDMFFLFLFATV